MLDPFHGRHALTESAHFIGMLTNDLRMEADWSVSCAAAPGTGLRQGNRVDAVPILTELMAEQEDS